MPGRTKIKSKVVKATLANKDVLDMFQGVLGEGGGASSLAVTHPKYLRIEQHVNRFLRLLKVFHDSSALGFFAGPKEHLGNYITALRAQFTQSFNAPDLDKYLAADSSGSIEDVMTRTADYSKIPPEAVAAFNDTFAAVKKCSLVNTVIVSCKNLVAHKKSLQDQSALKDRFLTKGGGMTFAPLPDLPQVNFKQIYIDGRLSSSDKEFVMIVLHKMFTIGHDVYEAVSAPDVNVEEFVEVIMSSIGEVKKHIPRCDAAFAKIIESVDLLKGNFDGYYKDYTASGNPTIIMENFVLDVSKNTDASPAVTAQFRRIITHYRKLASQQSSHPQLQSLFAQVDANFSELEKQSREADAAEESESDDDDEEKKEAPTTGKTARNRRKREKARAKAKAAKAAAAEPGAAEPEAANNDEEGLADEFDREEKAKPNEDQVKFDEGDTEEPGQEPFGV